MGSLEPRRLLAAKSLGHSRLATGSQFTSNCHDSTVADIDFNGRPWSRSRLSGLLGSNWGSAQECQK